MSIYTPTAKGLVPYDCPDDGDDVDAASVNVGLQHLGDVTRLLMPGTAIACMPDAVRLIVPTSSAPAAGPALNAMGTFVPLTSAQVDNNGTQLGFVRFVTVNSMAQAAIMHIPLDELTAYNGWTLVSAVAKLKGKAGHGGLPADMPRIAVVRFGASANAALNSGSDWQVDGAGSVGAYEADHDVTYTCNQNNVIDCSQYRYALLLQNESNTNSLDSLTAKLITLNLTAPT